MACFLATGVTLRDSDPGPSDDRLEIADEVSLIEVLQSTMARICSTHGSFLGARSSSLLLGSQLYNDVIQAPKGRGLVEAETQNGSIGRRRKVRDGKLRVREGAGIDEIHNHHPVPNYLETIRGRPAHKPKGKGVRRTRHSRERLRNETEIADLTCEGAVPAAANKRGIEIDTCHTEKA